ncbi:MAG: hypothetical protein Q4A75_07500 [Peptostreptococcaceae bacterium]|nr:hypothetical protein [Peptostreptococcaceae bacterium]
MNKGSMQNVTIILLVMLSLVLLSIRFELFIVTGAANSGTLSSRSTLKYSVRPNTIIFDLGAENSTKILDKNGFYYLELSRILEDSIKNKISVEPVLRTDHREKRTSKNIQLIFEPAIDQRLLYGSLFLEDGSIGDFDKIREIIIPQNYDTSIYLETEDDRYFEIKNTSLNTMANFDSFIGPGSKKYYSISERFPEFTDNHVLISDEARLPSYVTVSMFNDENTEQAIRGILGSKYDLANRIAEIDGSIIVTYDYGREIIKISPEGKLFYFNKDAGSNRKRMSVSDAVSVAMNMVSEIVHDQANYVVEHIAEYRDEKNVGYEVSLSRRLDGIRVSFKNDEAAIKMVVINGKVYSMEGIFRVPTIEVDNNLAFSENAVLLILEQNYDHIQKLEPFANTGELFDKIHSVEYSYVYSSDYNYIACYRMVIGKTTFFFKISDAEVIV